MIVRVTFAHQLEHGPASFENVVYTTCDSLPRSALSRFFFCLDSPVELQLAGLVSDKMFSLTAGVGLFVQTNPCLKGFRSSQTGKRFGEPQNCPEAAAEDR